MSPVRRRTWVAAAVVGLTLLLARPLSADAAKNGVTFPSGATHVTIPLGWHDDVVTIPVSIGGQDAGRFLIDTGSADVVIDGTLAARLKLPGPPQDPAAPVAPRVAELRQISLGGVPVGSRFAFVRDLRALGHNVAGILGTAALRDTPFTLDLRAPSLTFYPPGQVPEGVKTRGTPTPLTLTDGRFVVRAAVDGRPGRFALDTGTPGLAIMVADSFAPGDHDARPPRRFGPDAPPAPVRIRIDRLDLPGKMMARPWATLVQSGSATGGTIPPGCVGVIGPRVLGDGRWTIDAAAGSAWVEWPAPEAPDAYANRLMTDHRSTTPLPPILRAIEDNRPDAVRPLLARDADVNARPPRGSSGLARAADAPQLLRALLSGGAIARAVGPDGRPALVAAAEAGNAESVRLLIAAGARPDDATPAGVTALHRAAEADDAEISAALLDAGANPNAAASDGATPLILAAQNGAARTTQVLLQRGANVRGVTRAGHTALHAAATSRNPAVVRALLAAGADPNAAAASDGATPLSVAAAEDDPECARILLAAGASPASRAKSGATPLSVAVNRGHVRCVEALRAPSRPPIESPHAAASALRIPLGWAAGAPCARVTLGGGDAGWFLISLASPVNVIDAKVATRLNLPRLGTARLPADWGDATGELCEASNLAMEGHPTGPRVLVAADLDTLPFAGGGSKIAGILGWPALLGQPVTLDLREPSLTFHRPGAVPPQVTAGAMPLRARFLPAGPAVWARVQDEAGWFRLDSRVAPDELVELTHAFATARADVFHGRHLRTNVVLRGGRPVDRPLARLDALSLAGQRIAPAPAAVAFPSESPWRQTLDGRLALPTRDLRLTLDPQSGKAWLEWLAAEPLNDYLARIEKSSSVGPAPQSPLCRAIEDNRVPAVEVLLNRGADPNAANPAGLTPLMLAADRPALLDLLLRPPRPADVNATAPFLAGTALLRAAEAGNVAAVRRLLAAGAKVDPPNSLGQTPLFRAAEADYPDVISALAQAGADLNRASREGWTPLTVAASRNSAGAVAALLRAGADANLPAAGHTPPLTVAAFKGHAETCRLLIAARAELDRPNGGGMTPLMAAASTNHAAVLRLLLQAGADPARAVANRTAYDVAAAQSHLDAMTILKFGPR